MKEGYDSRDRKIEELNDHINLLNDKLIDAQMGKQEL